LHLVLLCLCVHVLSIVPLGVYVNGVVFSLLLRICYCIDGLPKLRYTVYIIRKQEDCAIRSIGYSGGGRGGCLKGLLVMNFRMDFGSEIENSVNRCCFPAPSLFFRDNHSEIQNSSDPQNSSSLQYSSPPHDYHSLQNILIPIIVIAFSTIIACRIVLTFRTS
jgi:hypothetical protein